MIDSYTGEEETEYRGVNTDRSLDDAWSVPGRDTSWMTDELPCVQNPDPDLWIAEISHRGNLEEGNNRMSKVRKICAACPMFHKCWDDAITTRDFYTVRAGTTGPERRRIIAEAKKAEADALDRVYEAVLTEIEAEEAQA